MRPRQFASDNVSGACPEAMAALAEANRDHALPYGGDAWTARAADALRRLVGAPEAEVRFVLTGTAANAIALSALAPPHGVVFCHPAAHVLNDECGAPGAFGGGLQLRAVAGPHGRIDPAALAGAAAHASPHAGRPAAVTLTQATEVGTVYRPADLEALREAAAAAGLRVHMDGARLANAAAALDVPVARLVEASGAAAVTVGGTKNGLPGSEALVVLDPEAARDLDYRLKRAGHLASKARFLAAPWVGVLESGAWRRNAERANAVAARLERGARALGLEPVHPREANELFLPLRADAVERLRARGWEAWDDPAWGGVRLVASWDSTPDDADAFLADLAASL